MATEGWQRKAYSIAAMRTLARSALPRPVFDFADGAAEDERTLRRNEAAFGEIAFLPKPLDGPATRDLGLTLFGQRLSMPVIIGPTGLAGLFWPDGEILTARAATKAGTAYCLSHGSVCRLEDLNQPGIGTRWMQVFIYRDRGFTLELTERAQAAGYGALVLTIDNQLIGRRERDLVNGFTIPPRFGLADLAGMATKIGWLLRMRTALPRVTFGNYVKPGDTADIATLAGRMGQLLDPGMNWADVDLAGMATKIGWLLRMRTALPRVTFGNYVKPGDTADIATLAGRMGQLLDPGMNWADVDLVRKAWRGPLLIKGVLHPDEAREAVRRGVDGLIVSNHGGRQLDGAIASIEALPAILAAVEGQVPVLMDGGVRRGADVVRALALGATACLIGRPHLWGLSVAGEAGVAHVLELYRSEMDRVMGLLGARTLADLTPALLAPRRSSQPAA